MQTIKNVETRQQPAPENAHPSDAFARFLNDFENTHGTGLLRRLVAYAHEEFGARQDKKASTGTALKPGFCRSHRLDVERLWNEERKPMDFVLPGFKVGTVGLLAGAGGTSKSFLALQTAISIVVGRDVFGLWNGAEIKRGRVVFLSLEDDTQSLHDRLQALKERGVLTVAEVATVFRDLDLISIYGKGFKIAERKSSGIIEQGEHVADVADFSAGARLVIVDTMSRVAAGLDENSAADMSAVMTILEEVADRTGAAVLVLHHLNKEGTFRGAEESLDQGATRGSSLIVDNARWLALLATMNEAIAVRRYGDEADQHVRRWTKRMHPKQNYGAPVESAWLRRTDGGLLDGTVEVQDAPAANDAGGEDDGEIAGRRRYQARRNGGH